MDLPVIDDSVREGFCALPFEEVYADYGFKHDLMKYGVEAVAHFYLMKMGSTIDKEVEAEEVVEMFGLELEPGKPLHFHNRRLKTLWTKGFEGPLKAVEKGGIFIPPQAYFNLNGEPYDKKVDYFSADYTNRIMHDAWIDKEAGKRMVNGALLVGHLLWLSERGMAFARELWRTCIADFEKHDEGRSDNTRRLGNALIDYYSLIIDGA